MRVLAIETSTMLGGVAVVDSGAGLLAEVRVNVMAAHSERLMLELDHVLRSASLSFKDLDAIAVSAGPGSFTGLRIGLGTVKGLAYSTGLPVVAVPTLEALAWNFPCSSSPVCAALDARKGEVYAGIFLWADGGFRRLMPEASLKPKELVLRAADAGRTIFTGQGAFLHRRLIEEALGPDALFAPHNLAAPSPASVAQLGLALALRGEFSETASLRPVYIRKSEAELKRPK